MTTTVLTREERYCAGRKFSRNLRNLGEAAVYFYPPLPDRPTRGIVMRSVSTTRSLTLPVGAVFIGVYTPPFSTEDFLDDLDAVLVKEIVTAQHRAHDQDLISATSL